MVEIYKGRCMKCKTEVVIQNPEIVQMKAKGGRIRRAVKGKCGKCQTVVFRILPKIDNK